MFNHVTNTTINQLMASIIIKRVNLANLLNVRIDLREKEN